jgi:maleamate amidohydrolase
MFWIEIDNSKSRDNQLGFGHQPALLLINFVQAYTHRTSPLFSSGLSHAVGETADLLSLARQSKIPIFHSNIKYASADLIGNLWLKKTPSMTVMTAGNALAEFCDPVAPTAGETVITRNCSSAFFGTKLDQSLREHGIDTLVLAGGPTSDAIRSTAVDGIQHGFRVIVVRECVGDRYTEVSEVHLREIDRSYGDVVVKDRVIEAFRFAKARR